MTTRSVGILSALVVLGLAGIVTAEDVATIADLLKSPGTYQAKTVIVRGTVMQAPAYRAQDPTCGRIAYIQRFKLADEAGSIGVTAMGCLHGTFTGYGSQLEQLTNGMKLEVMGRVRTEGSGVVIEATRMTP